MIQRLSLASENGFMQVATKSVSAGALFYIAAVEIVNEEFITENPHRSKHLAFTAGILFMMLTTIIFAE